MKFICNKWNICYDRPIGCNKVTPLMRTIKHPKSDNSASVSFLNCLPKARLNNSTIPKLGISILSILGIRK